MFDPTDRGQFLNLAGFVQGSLVLVALMLAWISSIDPWQFFRWEWEAIGWGIAAALPLFVLFLLGHFFAFGPMLRIRQFLVRILGPSLSACRWYDLLLLAILAGFSEELLFRGILQPWIGRIDSMTGLIGSNVLFGVLHMITPLYALWAGLAGVYLGLLLNVTGEPNLMTPMVTHALYDYLAFLVILRSYRFEVAAEAEEVAADEEKAE